MQVISISIILRVFEHLEFEREANTDPVKLPSHKIYKMYSKNLKKCAAAHFIVNLEAMDDFRFKNMSISFFPASGHTVRHFIN